MDPYSLLLAAALAASIAAVLLGASVMLRPDSSRDHAVPGPQALRHAGRWSGLAGVTLVVASALTHVLTGHRPGTADALGPLAFARAHPAMLVALALGAAGIVLSRPERPGDRQ